ncbi:uncharacterized protein LOC120839697 isoform X2 [Ixodes scapularis]|uniref:uncharacterized protein LOC120839697 isoform X2 n=1 Tax=Ixodes scapularis TaxID=6945 RepID=UPI001A9D8CCD|nr:uncharacterized protein LOC120839697 isoform X2 [Ixodes scapularis]
MSAPANRRRCSVKGCKVSDRDSESFSSHVAPKDDKLKAIWLEAIGRSRSDKRVQVCSRHFAPEVFELSTAHTERPRLRHGAVPTLFLPGATAATAASSLITGSTWPAPVPNRDSRVGSLSTTSCLHQLPRKNQATQHGQLEAPVQSVTLLVKEGRAQRRSTLYQNPQQAFSSNAVSAPMLRGISVESSVTWLSIAINTSSASSAQQIPLPKSKT